ncbi:U-scoloptoxin(19)-Sm1a [Bicyclus anynana]|uniref:U-scoloptoxin(19)-Sm1a n=1 Tax=Bicyclus anynana TaxID=110368 RepID=A0A6J1MTG8_BICAN|nr:U-scoloptoxin(19)-Sm1a [Bicyclus anynana]
MKIAVLVIVVLGVVSANEADLRIIDSIVQEQPCIHMGGICTVAEDCPKGHLAEKPGLCPTQRKQGIDCCHGVSLKETRCEKHGGVCMTHATYCNPRLIFDGAKDCPQDHHCCIMTL